MSRVGLDGVAMGHGVESKAAVRLCGRLVFDLHLFPKALLIVGAWEPLQVMLLDSGG